METTHVPATLEVRETTENPDVAGIVWGTAVPYDTPIDLGGVREQFAPEAINAEDVVGVPVCWRHDEPVGVITKAENTPEGLVVEANLANTALGRDAATLVRTGSVQGLSVGFKPVENAWNKTRDTVTRVRAALSELSLTHMPAYQPQRWRLSERKHKKCPKRLHRTHPRWCSRTTCANCEPNWKQCATPWQACKLPSDPASQ